MPLVAAGSPQQFDVEAVRATKRVAAVRIAHPVVVDGSLDEEVWLLAGRAIDFHQLSNIRFNLIHHPLSDIYVVWNETRLPGDTRHVLLLKYTHLIAF